MWKLVHICRSCCKNKCGILFLLRHSVYWQCCVCYIAHQHANVCRVQYYYGKYIHQSVLQSHSGTVSKWMHILWNSFHHVEIKHYISFFGCYHHFKKFQGNVFNGGIKIHEAHGYYGSMTVSDMQPINPCQFRLPWKDRTLGVKFF